MSKKKSKKKNHNLRSKVYKVTGTATTGLTTMGGFVAYGAFTDWAGFKQDLDNFIVVQQESIKLNLALAIPMLIGVIVFLFVTMKKNKDFFSDKVSIGLLTTILICYLIYSIIEITLASLVGAFVGSVIDEFGFSMLANKNKQKAEEEKEVDSEYEKELRRIKAREKARETLNGSV